MHIKIYLRLNLKAHNFKGTKKKKLEGKAWASLVQDILDVWRTERQFWYDVTSINLQKEFAWPVFCVLLLLMMVVLCVLFFILLL